MHQPNDEDPKERQPGELCRKVRPMRIEAWVQKLLDAGEINAAVFGVRMVPVNPDGNRSQNRHERQHIEIPPSLQDPSSLSPRKPQGHRSVRLQNLHPDKGKDAHRHEPDVRLSFLSSTPIHRAPIAATTALMLHDPPVLSSLERH